MRDLTGLDGGSRLPSGKLRMSWSLEEERGTHAKKKLRSGWTVSDLDKSWPKGGRREPAAWKQELRKSAEGAKNRY